MNRQQRKKKPLQSVSRRTFNRRIRQNVDERLKQSANFDSEGHLNENSSAFENLQRPEIPSNAGISTDSDIIEYVLHEDIVQSDVNVEVPEDNLMIINSDNNEDRVDDDFEDFLREDEYGDFYNILDSETNTSENDSDNEFGEDTLGKELADWARSSCIPLTKITQLLSILRVHGHANLPRVAQTLLGTPNKCTKILVSPGEYVHIGIRKNIIRLISNATNPPLLIKVDVNIDGVPITNSTKKQFWPVLCRCPELSPTPFVIGIYYGLKKPDSSSDYLMHFVTEIKEIWETGITFCNQTFTIKLNAFICDAPAQAFVKGIVGHNGYHGCGRCTQTGEWLNKRLSFPELEFTNRTDESFKRRWDGDHHKNDSNLEELGIGMVTQFPSDYLHLLCLGVPKKLILFWTTGPLKTRLPFFKQQLISNGLHNCKLTQPCEFQRRCRGIDELCYWKGSEFRTFLLYTGPVVLKNVLSMEEYKNFLSLHIAARICNADYLINQLDVAKRLFEYFVKSFIDIYGEEYVSYNLHNLLHVVDDVKKFGKLENYSAFPFESYLGKIKKTLRSGNKLLEQAVNRIEEGLDSKIRKKPRFPILKKPFQIENENYFASIEMENWSLKVDIKNCYFMDNNNNVLKFIHVKQVNQIFLICGKQIVQKKNFYSTPLSSELLNIYEIVESSLTEHIFEYRLNEIKCKVFTMKHNGIMVSFPMCSN